MNVAATFRGQEGPNSAHSPASVLKTMQRLYIVLDVDQSFIYTPKGLEYMDANVSSLVKRHFSENRPYFP